MRHLRKQPNLDILKYGIGAIEKANEKIVDERDRRVEEYYEKLKAIDPVLSTDAPVESAYMRIEDLGLTTRSYRALHFAGIRTVADILRYSSRELMQLRNIGQKSCVEIAGMLKVLGFHLKDDTDENLATDDIDAYFERWKNEKESWP